MTSRTYTTDVAIIGAGPVGLFAVFQCGMLKMRCHVIDALEVAGGQCRALYPEKPIYDIPAYPKISAGDLIDQLEAQAAPFDPVYHLNQKVLDISKTDDDRWLVDTDKGTSVNAKVVIVAGGVGAFGPNRPPLDHIESYEGKSIFYAVKSRNDFKDRTLVIAGGGDSAVDWAVSLSEVAKKIYVVHRRDKFRAAPDMVDKLHALHDAGTIEIITNYQLHGLEGDMNLLSAVTIVDFEGNVRKLDAEILLPFFGLSMNLGPITHWGLELEKKHIKVDPASCATNIPGVYAIGDIAHYPGKLKLILTGFAEAALAAHSSYKLVHPDQVLHFEYSTTQGVPGQK